MFYQKKSFIDSMVTLMRECNKIVLKIYNSDFDVIIKNDNSPLTLADNLVNQHICKFLATFDNTIIISEENKNDLYQDRSEKQWCWLVDPIDGTKEFIKKNGQFTVNVGLVKNGVPVFGMVSIPVSDEIYYGVDNLGSFKITDQIITKLNVNSVDFTQKKLNIIASSSHMNDLTKKFIDSFDEPNIINVGSSIKLLYIAEGKADIYPRLAPTSEWDTCAAHAIVKYAGGKVFKFNHETMSTLINQELTYNKENLLNPYFIVY